MYVCVCVFVLSLPRPSFLLCCCSDGLLSLVLDGHFIDGGKNLSGPGREGRRGGGGGGWLCVCVDVAVGVSAFVFLLIRCSRRWVEEGVAAPEEEEGEEE